MNDVLNVETRNADSIKCIDGQKTYFIPRSIFTRVVLESNTPKQYVRYKTGADMYDMSERQFKEMARQAGAVRKFNRMVLVNLEIFNQFIECFAERPV